MEKNKKKTSLKGQLLVLILKLFAKLPLPVIRGMAWLIGQILYRISSKTEKVIRRNFEICFPELSAQETEALVKQTLIEKARLAMEIPVAWLGKRDVLERVINVVNNQSLIDNYVEQKQPLIVAVPHIGNWEFFWHWLQLNYPAIGMYRPAKIEQLDELMLPSRERYGGQAFATDAKGIMGLLKALKGGGVMMLLPDQAPRVGAGAYAPFFGKPAYTMTLLHRFMRKTNSRLLLGSCLRNSDGKGFSINLYSPDFDDTTDNQEAFNRGMNEQIESIIKLAPAQYQWGYKRFKRQADGRDLYH